MQLELSKEQFKEMLLAAMFYSWVCGGLADSKGEDFQKYEKLEEYLLKVAKENNFNDLVEEFEGHLVPDDNLSELVEETISEYDEDTFWFELVNRLGKRDFSRTITSEEKKELEKTDWLPDRIHDIYKKYEEEFDENGIERLEIKK